VPQEEQYNANIALKAIINACIRFIKSWGYEGIHLSYGGEVSEVISSNSLCN